VSLRDQLKKVSAERDRLRADCERLRAELGVARRADKRQAAPFSKGTKKPDPARPGRKPGEAYGKKGRRLAPAPEDVDETIGVGLPDACPACGGEVVFDKTLPQYQHELIVKVLRCRFDVDLGHCACCSTPVRGRHPEQTSDALGAAGDSHCSDPGRWHSRRGERSAAGYRHPRSPRCFAPLGVSASLPAA
jgi:transposase